MFVHTLPAELRTLKNSREIALRQLLETLKPTRCEAVFLFVNSLIMSKSEGRKNFFKGFDKLIHQGHDRARLFDDFLTISICALSGGRMEELYLQTISHYPKEVVRDLSKVFADLVMAMEEEKQDILGSYFEQEITRGENGQFFTPDPICTFMASIVETSSGETVNDPCCGSGRMLLASARVNPHCIFYGQDIDLRCVKMTTINLALNGLRGFVTWGDSLAKEQKLVYQTGFNGKGFVRELEVQEITSNVSEASPTPQSIVPVSLPPAQAGSQMSLF